MWIYFSDDATFFWTHLTAPKGGVIGNREQSRPNVNIDLGTQ